jgi:hypothetical protein
MDSATSPTRKHARGMAVGLGLGLIATGFTAVLSHSESVVFAAIAVQAGSAAVFLNVAFLGVHLDSRVLIGVGFLAHAAWTGFITTGTARHMCGPGIHPSASSQTS